MEEYIKFSEITWYGKKKSIISVQIMVSWIIKTLTIAASFLIRGEMELSLEGSGGESIE